MALRAKLEGSREAVPLFDTQRWVASLEAGLKKVWERHEKGLEPDHVDAPDAQGRPSEL